MTFYTVSSGSLQTGGAISCLLPVEEMGQEINLLQLLLPEGLVFTMKTTHTHTQQSATPNVVLYHPAWWITALSAMKTRQLCTQWWELDRVEWARTVPEEEEGGQTKAASFLLLSVVGSDVWSSRRVYDSIICVWKWGWKLMADILYIHICTLIV